MDQKRIQLRKQNVRLVPNSAHAPISDRHAASCRSKAVFLPQSIVTYASCFKIKIPVERLNSRL
jgi:hypothetical protein